MPRSGSTWSFNVVSNLLRITHPTAQIHGVYSEVAAEFLANQRADFLVVKCHSIDAAGQDAMVGASVPSVYTVRDPREAITSMMDFVEATFEEALETIVRSLQYYDTQQRHGHVVAVNYADMITRPLLSISRIAEHLHVTADSGTVSRVEDLCSRIALTQISAAIETFDVDEVHREDRYLYHRATLIHRRHFTNAGVFWKERLTPRQRDEIEAKTQQWSLEFNWGF